MTHTPPPCARRRLASAVGLVTPSHGSTPRATRSSKLNSVGSVLSSQIVTRSGYRPSFLGTQPGNQPTRSGVQDGGSLAGKDSCDSSVTLSPSAVSSRPPCPGSAGPLAGVLTVRPDAEPDTEGEEAAA